jgi:hypothetical protein
MAIRLREVDGRLVALCAALTTPQEDDIYLDDNVHYALACKFARDHLKHGIDWNDEVDDELARSQYITGAQPVCQ